MKDTDCSHKASCAPRGSISHELAPAAQHVQRSSESFWGEAEVLASVNHPNVLRFYGVVTQSKADPTCVGIMTEYMRGGSLANMIR
jgi:serine/threonine protein kinase